MLPTDMQDGRKAGRRQGSAMLFRAAHSLVRAGRHASGDVWVNTAHRSAKHYPLLAAQGLVSRIRRQNQPGQPMEAGTQGGPSCRRQRSCNMLNGN
jgi:hypothetical protein